MGTGPLARSESITKKDIPEGFNVGSTAYLFAHAKLLRLFQPADSLEKLLIPRLSVTLAWLITLALPSLMARVTENSTLIALGSWTALAFSEVALHFAEKRATTAILVMLSILTLALPFGYVREG